MRKFLLFLFLITFCATQAQEIQYVKLDFSCDAGIKEAETDIENGILKVLSYGLIMWKEPEFRDFYVNFVKENYNVILGNGGCIVSEKSDCYTETMRKAVLGKYGEDFFEKSHQEAKSLYEKEKV